MKSCPTCSHTQEDGNFCGKCGTPLSDHTEQTSVPETVATNQEAVYSESHSTTSQPEPTQPNEQIEKLKTESKQFFSFLLQQLKSPSQHFNQVNSGIKNSLISISLYILLTAIAIFSIVRSLFGGGYGYFGPSLVQVVFYLTLFSLLVLAVNLTAIFVTSKLFSESLTFGEVTRKVGGYYVLPIAFSLGSILLALIHSYTLSSIILYIGAILAFGTVPTFVMMKLLASKSKSVDGFYAFLFYIAFTAVIGFILGLLIMDSAIGELLGYMNF